MKNSNESERLTDKPISQLFRHLTVPDQHPVLNLLIIYIGSGDSCNLFIISPWDSLDTMNPINSIQN